MENFRHELVESPGRASYHSTTKRWGLWHCCIRRRDESMICLLKASADGLDPTPFLVSIDVGDYVSVGLSRSAAKSSRGFQNPVYTFELSVFPEYSLELFCR